ncbi:hypothetical protein SSTU70S_04119 [Stutzerimonas stutzeri]
MLNFIGEVPEVARVIAVEDCHLHHYGKAFKAGRKVGHATLRCPDRATLDLQHRGRDADQPRLTLRSSGCRERNRRRPGPSVTTYGPGRITWALGTILIGLIVGLIARFLKPGNDSMGWIMTILLGIGGSLLASYGGQALGLYEAGEGAGFIGAVVGAIILLVIYGALTRRNH